MKIINLFNNYIQYTRDGDLKKYFSACPQLFSHYTKYWINNKKFHPNHSIEVLRENLGHIITVMPEIERDLTQFGLDIKNLTVIIFVGASATNGHAFQDNDGQFVVWLPIEAYATELRAKIFVTHEMIHAIHYTIMPSLYFKNIEEMKNLGNCLVAEGCASYLTMKVLNIASSKSLFADYISSSRADDLMAQYYKEEQKIRSFAKKNFDKSGNFSMFYASNQHRITEYKAGYVLGLRLCEEIIKKLQIPDTDVLTIEKEKFFYLLT